MNVVPSTVDGLVEVENEFLFEVDDGVGWEDDPKGFILDDGMPERSQFSVNRVMIGGIGDGVVDPTAFIIEGASKHMEL